MAKVMHFKMHDFQHNVYVVAGSCDHIELLFSCKVDELNRISGYTDRKVCVFFFFRMFHSVDQVFLFRIRLRSGDVHPERKYPSRTFTRLFVCVPPYVPVASGLMVWYWRFRQGHPHSQFATEFREARSPFCSAP